MTRSPAGPGTTGQPWSRRRDPATCARHLSRATHAAAVARVGLRTLKKFNIEYIRMLLSEIIKELNEENAPPGGWREGDKLTSPQAGSRKGRGHKLKVQALVPSQQAQGSGSQGTSVQAGPGHKLRGYRNF